LQTKEDDIFVNNNF